MTVVRLKRAARVILVGAPGVGKGTQAKRLMKRFPDVSTMSSGDLLRANVRDKTPLGLRAEEAIKAGQLIPDETMVQLIHRELEARQWIGEPRLPPEPFTLSMTATTASTSSGAAHFPHSTPMTASASDEPSASFILDGFPRTATQAKRLASFLPINLVVSLVTPADIVVARLARRWIHAPSGRVYSDDFSPPRIPGQDDLTGEPLTKRPDDQEDVVRARLQQFDRNSAPLLEYYERQGVLWTVRGNSSDEISPALFREFEGRFA